LLFAAASLSASQDSANSVVDEFKKARDAEEHGEYHEAITCYQHILSLNPVATEAYSNLGLDYYRLNRYAEAAAALKNALKIQPSLVRDQIVLGLAEFKMGRFKDSRYQLESALKVQPNNREIRFFLVQDQMALGQFDDAFVNQTLGQFPTDAELNYTIGLAALERMREIAHQAQSLGPQSPIYQWIYLRQAQERQDSADAQKHQEALEKLGATDPPPVVRDYDDLISLVNQCFTTVLQSSPDSSYAHSVQGSIDEAQNLIDEGLAEYRKAGNHFAAGRLLAQNLRLPEAAEELEATLRSDPENHLALALLAQVYVQQHEPERALPLLHVILRYYPGDALAWSDLGKAQMSLNKTAEGIDSLRRSLKIDSSQTHLHYELAMAYRKLGDSDSAQRELAEFKKASEAEHDK
jgi:tetratricopeptide (TPR) repeat protein